MADADINHHAADAYIVSGSCGTSRAYIVLQGFGTCSRDLKKLGAQFGPRFADSLRDMSLVTPVAVALLRLGTAVFIVLAAAIVASSPLMHSREDEEHYTVDMDDYDAGADPSAADQAARALSAQQLVLKQLLCGHAGMILAFIGGMLQAAEVAECKFNTIKFFRQTRTITRGSFQSSCAK